VRPGVVSARWRKRAASLLPIPRHRAPSGGPRASGFGARTGLTVPAAPGDHPAGNWEVPVEDAPPLIDAGREAARRRVYPLSRWSRRPRPTRSAVRSPWRCGRSRRRSARASDGACSVAAAISRSAILRPRRLRDPRSRCIWRARLHVLGARLDQLEDGEVVHVLVVFSGVPAAAGRLTYNGSCGRGQRQSGS
jgi:hypothetical protein